MGIPTISDIVNTKKLSNEKYEEEIEKLNLFSGNQNVYNLSGNPIIYHHQMVNLLKVKAGNTKSFYEYMNDPNLKKDLINMTIKRKGEITPINMFETYRANKNSVSFFKASTAKYIYKHYKAKSVLDFTAGWGGRMLGAYSLDIKYTGIDTNMKLKKGYDDMMKKLNDNKLKMIWKSCLKVDLSKIDFDLVLTSPPYINLEVYEMMNLFKDKDDFYNNFLIIMLDRCSKHISNNGWICINMSIEMYNDLTNVYKYKKCNERHILPNATNQKNPDKKEYIYCWKVNRP